MLRCAIFMLALFAGESATAVVNLGGRSGVVARKVSSAVRQGVVRPDRDKLSLSDSLHDVMSPNMLSHYKFFSQRGQAASSKVVRMEVDVRGGATSNAQFVRDAAFDDAAASSAPTAKNRRSLPRGVLEVDTQNNMTRIAKYLPAAEGPHTRLSIPRVIWQTWKDDGRFDPTSLWVPTARANIMLTWIEKNPTWEYRLLDDADRELYASRHYGPEVLETLRSLHQGASKADFWRYLAIHHDGGAYFDSDTGCEVPLDEWFDPETTYITGPGGFKEFHQWGIVAQKDHCIAAHAINLVIENVQTRDFTTHYNGVDIVQTHAGDRIDASFEQSKRSFSGVVGLAGPAVLMEAANKCLANSTTRAAVLSGFRLCSNNNFGHRTNNPWDYEVKSVGSTWSDAKALVVPAENGRAMSADAWKSFLERESRRVPAETRQPSKASRGKNVEAVHMEDATPKHQMLKLPLAPCLPMRLL
jgi:hypothetical protein